MRGLQIHIVADVHHRRQKAHVLGELFTDTADTAQQFTVLLKIDHRDQTIAHFHAERIFQLHIVPGGFHHRVVFRNFSRLWLDRRLLFTSPDPPGQSQQRGGKHQEDEVWHTRHQPQQPQHGGAEQHHAGVAEQLPDHLLADILIGTDAGNDHTRRS